MNAKISVLVICVEAIKYLLLYNLHDCTFTFSTKALVFSSMTYIQQYLTNIIKTYHQSAICRSF